MYDESIHNKNLKSTDVSVKLEQGYEAKIVVTKQKATPAFFMVGNGNLNRKLDKRNRPMDLIKLMANMSSSELYVVLQLRTNLYPEEVKQLDGTTKLRTTCKVDFALKNLTSADKRKFQRGFKLLREKDIVRRIKRSSFMFNPNFMIPSDYESEYFFYTKLK